MDSIQQHSCLIFAHQDECWKRGQNPFKKMEIKIYKDVAEYNKVETAKGKRVVFVEFPNCISKTTNRAFKWMPTYQQLIDIKKALNEIESESWK